MKDRNLVIGLLEGKLPAVPRTSRYFQLPTARSWRSVVATALLSVCHIHKTSFKRSAWMQRGWRMLSGMNSCSGPAVKSEGPFPLGPFPRHIWIHDNTPQDGLDKACHEIWKRTQSLPWELQPIVCTDPPGPPWSRNGAHSGWVTASTAGLGAAAFPSVPGSTEPS